MEVFKKLIKGELSLAVTFWGWLVFGNIILVAITTELFSFMARYSVQSKAIIFTLPFIIKFIIACMVASGIFFMLRKKITVWRIIAFIISIPNIVYASMYMMAAIYVNYEAFY